MKISVVLNHARQRFMSLNSFVGQVSWTMGANIGMSATGMLTGLLAARLLGPQGRGELAAIQSWALLIGSLATLGMSEAAIYFIGRHPEQSGRFLLSAYSLTLFPGIIFAVIGWWLMPWLLGAQSTAVIGAARVFLLVMIPMFGTFIYYEALRAIGFWREWNLLRLLPNLVWMLMLISAFFESRWANAVFLSWLYPAVFLVQMIPSIWLVWHHASGSFEIQPKLFPSLLGYSLPTMLSVLPHTLNLRLDQILMAGFLNSRSLGLYAVAVAWSGASTLLFTAVGQVLFPRLSGISDRGQQRLLLVRVIRITVLGDLALTVILLVLTPFMLPFLFGTDYSSAVPAALVLVIANGFINLNSTLASGLQGLGNPRGILRAEVCGLVVTATLLFILLPRIGSLGAALASLSAYVTVSIFLADSLKRTTALAVSNEMAKN